MTSTATAPSAPADPLSDHGWQKILLGMLLAMLGYSWALLDTSLSVREPAAPASSLGTLLILDSATVYETLQPRPAQGGPPPPRLSEGKRVALPHLPARNAPTFLRYDIPFTVEPGHTGVPLGLCILRSSMLEGIWLNGERLRLQPGRSLGQSFRVNPIFQSLPHPMATGAHRLEIVTRSVTSTPSGLSRIRLGAEELIHRQCVTIDQEVREREAGSIYLMGFICALALAAALVLRSRATLFVGLLAGLWLLNRQLINSDSHAVGHDFWTWLLYVARPLVAVPLALYCLDVTERFTPANLKRLAAFFITGYVAFLFTPMDKWQLWLMLFGLACLGLLLVLGGMLLLHSSRRPGYAATVLSAALAFALLANAADVLRALGVIDWAHPSVTYWSAPALCLGLGIQVLENMLKHVNLEKAMARKLHREVEQQRLVLESEFRKAKVKNEKIAVLEERKRILREMHDGLGSQLVSASALVRHPTPDMAAIGHLIDNAIQEMRIFLDVLSTPQSGSPEALNGSLNVLLAKLRQHIEPVLRAKGMVLQWDVDELPDALLPSDRSRIHLLRLLQEAAINAVRHANATTLAIRASTHGPQVEIEVTDDGIGWQEGRRPGDSDPGYGIANMKKRASVIGAGLVFEDASPGSTVRISLRVPNPYQAPVAADSA